MPAAFAGIATVAGGIIGDIMQQQGQQGANAMSAAEADKQMAFQAQQTQQVEQWEENLSDTAMQRRVADLKAANLNPILAVGQGGASQPSVGVPSGAMGSVQNPNASFGNMGMQVSSALQTESQIDLQKAQADNANAQARLATSQTPSGGQDGVVTIGPNHDLGDAQVAKIQADTGVSTAQAAQVKALTQLVASQTNETNIKAALSNVDLTVLRATQQYLIQEEAAKGATARNVGEVQSSQTGRVLQWINSILQPISTAVGAARGISLPAGSPPPPPVGTGAWSATQ